MGLVQPLVMEFAYPAFVTEQPAKCRMKALRAMEPASRSRAAFQVGSCRYCLDPEFFLIREGCRRQTCRSGRGTGGEGDWGGGGGGDLGWSGCTRPPTMGGGVGSPAESGGGEGCSKRPEAG